METARIFVLNINNLFKIKLRKYIATYLFVKFNPNKNIIFVVYMRLYILKSKNVYRKTSP